MHQPDRRSLRRRLRDGLVAIVFGLLALPAAAAFPPPALLDELAARLSEPPPCHPHCVAIQSMALQLDQARWRMTFEIHAETTAAMPLPAADGQWWPDSIEIEEHEPAAVLLRDADGTLWLLAPAGRHRLRIAGPAPLRSQVDLPLPLRPARVIDAGNAAHWVVKGVNGDGVPQGALQLIRRQATAAAGSDKGLEPGELPALLEVSRTLQLGLDWRVLTRIQRLSPSGSPLTLELPLIDGEAVTSAGIEVIDAKARLHLPAGTGQIEFSSRLSTREQIRLEAPEDVRWTERWRIDAAPVWHVEHSGIPAIHHQDGQGAWLPTFAPWPGESLTLQITRPTGVSGSQLTIDQSRLQLSAGQRARDATLTLELRASQGGQHAVRLPEGAQLRSVSIDGSSQPIRQQADEVVLPIRPGAQSISLAWRQEQMLGTRLHTPAVDLGIPSVNHSISVDLGRDRWVLFTQGPLLGPAVLFWSTLPVIVLIAFSLGRSRLTPLKTRHWILLGIGLTQLDTASAALIVGWLLALGARDRVSSIDSAPRHNLIQLGLALLTLVALGALFEAVSRGLLGYPAMQIEGNGSSAYQLHWYQDRVGTTPDQAKIVSVPLWAYRIAMLLWALWLAFALLRWLKWGWSVISRDGLWQRIDWRPRWLRRTDKPGPSAGT